MNCLLVFSFLYDRHSQSSDTKSKLVAHFIAPLVLIAVQPAHVVVLIRTPLHPTSLSTTSSSTCELEIIDDDNTLYYDDDGDAIMRSGMLVRVSTALALPMQSYPSISKALQQFTVCDQTLSNQVVCAHDISNIESTEIESLNVNVLNGLCGESVCVPRSMSTIAIKSTNSLITDVGVLTWSPECNCVLLAL